MIFFFCWIALIAFYDCAKYQPQRFYGAGYIGVKVVHNNIKIWDQIHGRPTLGRPLSIILIICNSPTKMCTKKLFWPLLFELKSFIFFHIWEFLTILQFAFHPRKNGRHLKKHTNEGVNEFYFILFLEAKVKKI